MTRAVNINRIKLLTFTFQLCVHVRVSLRHGICILRIYTERIFRAGNRLVSVVFKGKDKRIYRLSLVFFQKSFE